MSGPIKLIAKALVLAALLFGGTAAVRRLLPFGWADDVMQLKYETWTEEKEDYSVVFLGSSRIYRHVIPELFEEEVGADEVRSFNFGVQSLFSFERYAVLERLIDEAPPGLEAIICEFDVLVRYQPEWALQSTRGLYWREPRWTLSALRSDVGDITRTKKVTWDEEIEFLCENLVGLGMAVDVLYSISETERLPELLGPRRDGYYSLEQELADFDDDVLEQRRARGKVAARRIAKARQECLDAFAARGATKADREHVRLIEDYTERAAKKGIRLVFLLGPRSLPTTPILREFDALPPSQRIEVADPRLFPQLYSLEGSFDRAHLTREGAEVFTRALGQAYRELRKTW